MERQNTETKHTKKIVYIQNGRAQASAVMLALGVPALVLGSYTPRQPVSLSQQPQNACSLQQKVFCGATVADAGGALLGPVMGLPGSAGKGLSGRGGCLQPIHTSNIKQVC